MHGARRGPTHVWEGGARIAPQRRGAMGAGGAVNLCRESGDDGREALHPALAPPASSASSRAPGAGVQRGKGGGGGTTTSPNRSPPWMVRSRSVIDRVASCMRCSSCPTPAASAGARAAPRVPCQAPCDHERGCKDATYPRRRHRCPTRLHSRSRPRLPATRARPGAVPMQWLSRGLVRTAIAGQ